ncbi:MAG: phosphatase PAP2 family protein [Candidatus Ornithospirochaeta sp.]
MKKILSIILAILLLGLASLPASSGANSFDALAVYPYSKSLDKASTIIDAGIMASPALLAVGRTLDEDITLGVMYAETMAGAYLTKEILKGVVERERPYMSAGNPPLEDKDEWNESFPSGHTTMAFASASFLSYAFSKYYPDSKWKIPVTAASFTAATAVAVMRVRSGCHYMTDVAAGALIGTLWGIGIPMLHNLGENVEMGVTPFALAFSISF